MSFRPTVLIAIALLVLPPLSLPAQIHPDWRTPAEASDYRTTPDYAETVAYLERIAAAAPDVVKIENFGKTGEGRDLKIVIASKDGVFDPAAIHASGRAILLVQNAIHAGEMDGKDACLALLRDLVQNQATERSSWTTWSWSSSPSTTSTATSAARLITASTRTAPNWLAGAATPRNLNLNRDYMKADAPETRALPQDVSPLAAGLLRRRPRDRRRRLPVRRDLLDRRHARRCAGHGQMDS